MAASVAANVLHARPNPISQAIAAWPPLALLITVELISRVPVTSRRLAAASIAGIAAWISYWHMAGVVVIRNLRAAVLVDLGFDVVDMSLTGGAGRLVSA